MIIVILNAPGLFGLLPVNEIPSMGHSSLSGPSALLDLQLLGLDSLIMGLSLGRCPLKLLLLKLNNYLLDSLGSVGGDRPSDHVKLGENSLQISESLDDVLVLKGNAKLPGNLLHGLDDGSQEGLRVASLVACVLVSLEIRVDCTERVSLELHLLESDSVFEFFLLNLGLFGLDVKLDFLDLLHVAEIVVLNHFEVLGNQIEIVGKDVLFVRVMGDCLDLGLLGIVLGLDLGELLSEFSLCLELLGGERLRLDLKLGEDLAQELLHQGESYDGAEVGLVLLPELFYLDFET